MTPQEFKAWFEGYTEAFDDEPSPKQWKRIKARVAEIDGSPTSPAVFVERYWRPYYSHWTMPVYVPVVAPVYSPPYCSSVVGMQGLGVGSSNFLSWNQCNNTLAPDASVSVHGAFQTLGSMDAQADASSHNL